MDEELLNQQIRSELAKHFKKIDDDILNYLLSALSSNKDEFSVADDVEEAIGAILCELKDSSDSNNNVNVTDLCSKFFKMLRADDSSSESVDTDTIAAAELGIKQLAAPIKISSLNEPVEDEKVVKSFFQVNKENITYVNQKKLDKIEAKLKQKLEKKEKGSTGAGVNLNNYDSANLASTSQSLSRKADSTAESNRSFDIIIENFDVSFGNK